MPYNTHAEFVFWCQRPWWNSNAVTLTRSPNTGGVGQYQHF